MKKYVLVVTALILLISCNHKPTKTDDSKVLASWNEGVIKEKIMNFIQRDTFDIPVEDRIAVFDMDGTISCETPLWFEMYCAVAKLNDDLTKDPSLHSQKTYEYAQLLYKNPADKFVHDNWVSDKGNYIDSMVWKAFEGSYHEDYINYCTKYLTTTINKEKNMTLGDMFYKPMLELIELLQDNHYKVYVVSGSVQGVIWSIVPLKTSLKDRDQLVGTRQILMPDYSYGKSRFMIHKGIFTPKNNNDGKSENIYSKLGKQPVFAFGNTTGDFDMLQYAITNEHKGIGFLLNHDDSREYIYPPYHGKPEPNWKEEIDKFGGIIVNMKENFKKVW
jgi:beta-phosphoglucomutase-like phosphatase (HAD superfamily)